MKQHIYRPKEENYETSKVHSSTSGAVDLQEPEQEVVEYGYPFFHSL